MSRSRFWRLVRGAAGAAASLALAPLCSAQPVDLDAVHRIKDQAFHHSRVMDYVFELTDRNGPRLTGSPGHHRAADAVIRAMREAGIEDAGIEAWEGLGAGWSFSRSSVRLIEPDVAVLHAIPMAWSVGTQGPVRGEAVHAPLFEDADDVDQFDLERVAERIAAYRETHAGRLGGKIVLISPAHDLEEADEAAFRRFDEEALGDLAEAEMPAVEEPLTRPVWRVPADGEERGRFYRRLSPRMFAELMERRRAVRHRWLEFLAEEGAAAVLEVDGPAQGGSVYTDSYGTGVPGMRVGVPAATLTPEHYNRLLRLLDHGERVVIEVDTAARFHEDAPQGRNVLVSLPGAGKRDEIVMLGGHLDSWIGGTGASDNAAGCAVVMEAMRILAALDPGLDRTVRAAFWDGEEQGFHGSMAYVDEHFADLVTMELKPEHARLSAYFNVDNGGGKIRGLYLQGNDMARPIVEAWLEPFADLGVDTVSIRGTYFTDHHTFDSVGLPGFQFIQDPLEYFTRTHHTDLDTADHLQPGDLMQAAAVLASVVYHAANADAPMPRKPLPPPLPPEGPVPPILEYDSPGRLGF